MARRARSRKPVADPRPDPEAVSDPSRGRSVLIPVGAALYLIALLFSVGRLPAGLCNDAAEEGIRGLILVGERRLELITSALGNSAETLWLYLVGVSATLFGPSWTALVLPGIFAAAACLALGALLVKRLTPGTPSWVPLIVFASST